LSERKRIIYLAGPIQCANHAERTEWRDVATATLTALGYETINPLGKVGWPAKEIVEFDLADIERSDAVLAWVPLGTPSVGTAMEIFYAGRILRKPVVVWTDSHAEHPWLCECANAIQESLAAALAIFEQSACYLFPAEPPPAAGHSRDGCATD